MEIKTAAVIGAGAIGSYFIAGLSPKLKDGLWTVAAEPRIWRGTEGEGDDRRGSAFKPRNHVRKPVQNGKRWCDQLREGRGEKKNLCDHPAWKRDFGAGKKKDRAVAPEC